MLELFDKPERVLAYSRKASQDPINQKFAELALQRGLDQSPKKRKLSSMMSRKPKAGIMSRKGE